VTPIPGGPPLIKINITGPLLTPFSSHTVFHDEYFFDVPDGWGSIYVYNNGFLCDQLTYNASQLNPLWSIFPFGAEIGRDPVNGSIFISSFPSPPAPTLNEAAVPLPSGWNLLSLPLLQ